MNSVDTKCVVHEQMLIDGHRVDGKARIEVFNPARPDELVGSVVRGTAQDVDDAVAAGKRAHRHWSALTFTQRAAIIDAALSQTEADIDERATLFTRENGKPLAETRGELANVARRQRIALQYATTLDEGRKVSAPGVESAVLYRPFGVIVSIVPWNSPVGLAFTQIVAALLAGNCVVLKPPESCPLALTGTAACFGSALPDGVLNIVTGLPSEIGDALTKHPDVARIGFTGSIPSARHIMSNAAQTIKGVTLELGGNDAAIVLDDADLGTDTMKAMVGASFQICGQLCMAIKRIYVPTSRYEDFKHAYCAAVERLVIGDGLKPGVNIGPLHSKRGLERARELLEDAIARGAHVRKLGLIDDQKTFDSGFFMQPTVVTHISDEAPLVKEEQFSPIIPIVTYGTPDDAVERANDTVFGLGASVWSTDKDRASNVARRLEAGQVWINCHGPSAIDHRTPYGGMKQSGLGRRSGVEGILEYLQTQTVTARGF